jgi:hypothetical protein
MPRADRSGTRLQSSHDQWQMGETGSIQPSLQVTATEERSPLPVGQTMLYRGVEYEIEPIEPGVWKWQCRIGDRINTGKIKCKLGLLADRRVRWQ